MNDAILAAERAIRESIDTDRIVVIDASHSEDLRSNLFAHLAIYCDNWADREDMRSGCDDENRITEFWGSTDDGEDWRVNVAYRAAQS